MFDPEALKKIVTSGSVQFKENAVAFIFACPRCLKKDKLYIRKRDGRFVCWVCKETDNFKGRAEWALRELYHLKLADIQARLYGGDIPEQMTSLLNLEFVDVWGDLDEGDFGIVEEVPESVCWPPDFVGPDHMMFSRGQKYLAKRGVTDEHIKTYGIKYHPGDHRVIFPVVVDDRLLGWQARYILPTTEINENTGKKYEVPKIITSKTLSDKGGRFLMFQDRLRGSEHCVLAEGPISAIKADLCGGNVASMGKAVTTIQLETIHKYVRKLYIGLDPDAGEDIARIANDRFDDFEVYLLQPPAGADDLGDACPEAVFEQFKRAPRINRGTLFISLGSTLVH